MKIKIKIMNECLLYDVDEKKIFTRLQNVGHIAYIFIIIIFGKYIYTENPVVLAVRWLPFYV